MNTRSKTLALISVALFGLVGFAGAASADTWQQNHPRRVEVNRRLEHQTHLIARDEFTGRISPWRAARLLREENGVRREERFMASFDHGHITRAEQRALNQQENALRSRIP